MRPARLRAAEICAGAGGQALGLELAGFSHAVAVELDFDAAVTLSVNRPSWDVRNGDVTDPGVWDPGAFEGIDLLAGGVPCPPFSIAGRQLGAADERDLFAWAAELAGRIRPRALLLENVRGLAAPRFAAYRQHVAGRLGELGYWSQWRLLYASDYGVPQLRPRFVLVAMDPDDARWFRWPEPVPLTATVGTTLVKAMASRGWEGAFAWARGASDIAPTIVGGSKKHGGADLGPTRAKRAWLALGVDGRGIADAPPGPETLRGHVPRLTCEMVQLLQGWHARGDYAWRIEGRKTSRYRQIGNAFPPPVARAVGEAIAAALRRDGDPAAAPGQDLRHDAVYLALKVAGRPATIAELAAQSGETAPAVAAALANLERDFTIEMTHTTGGWPAYRLGAFRGYTASAGTARLNGGLTWAVTAAGTRWRSTPGCWLRSGKPCGSCAGCSATPIWPAPGCARPRPRRARPGGSGHSRPSTRPRSMPGWPASAGPSLRPLRPARSGSSPGSTACSRL